MEVERATCVAPATCVALPGGVSIPKIFPGTFGKNLFLFRPVEFVKCKRYVADQKEYIHIYDIIVHNGGLGVNLK